MTTTRPRTRVWIAVTIAVAAIVVGLFIATRHHHSAAKGPAAAPSALTATVQRTTVTSRSVVTGALGFQGSYAVATTNGGILTNVPTIGAVLSRGQTVYSIDNSPTWLLYGDVPV